MWGVRLGGLNMINSLHMPFYFKTRGVKENPFFKGPRGFLYVLIITCKVPSLEPVDGSTFDSHGVLVLGGDQQI